LLSLAFTPVVFPAEPPRFDRYGDPLPPGAVARLGTARWHTDGEVWSLAFSPDGRILASSRGGTDACIQLWDVTTGRPRLRIAPPGPGSYFRRLTFSPDGNRLISASYAAVEIWDTFSGRLLHEWPTPKLIAVAVSPDGNWLVWSDGESVCPIALRRGQPFPSLGNPPNRVVGVYFTAPDVLRLVESDGHAIWLCDAPTGRRIARAAEDQWTLTPVDMAPDGGRLLVAYRSIHAPGLVGFGGGHPGVGHDLRGTPPRWCARQPDSRPLWAGRPDGGGR
jgi:WD40 repeat protein